MLKLSTLFSPYPLQPDAILPGDRGFVLGVPFRQGSLSSSSVFGDPVLLRSGAANFRRGFTQHDLARGPKKAHRSAKRTANVHP